jgi:hypothetical protein
MIADSSYRKTTSSPTLMASNEADRESGDDEPDKWRGGEAGGQV